MLQRFHARTIRPLSFAAAVSLGGPGLCPGQSDGTDPPANPVSGLTPAQPPVDPLDITGRDFAGLRFAGLPESGDIVLDAAKVFAWTEPGAAPGEDGGTVSRLLLRGDVRVELGTYHFTASQAAVWLERLPLPPSSAPADGGDTAEPPPSPVHQIAIYFDRVSDPGAGVGISVAGDRLLVTGILQGSLTLRAASLSLERPVEPFVQEAERKLARTLRTMIGEPPPSPPDPMVSDDRRAAEAGPRGPIVPGVSRPYEPGSPLADEPQARADAARPAPPPPPPPLFARQGIITISQRLPTPESRWSYVGGEENAAYLTGGIVVQYIDRLSGKSLEITAQNAVVFFKPGAGGGGGGAPGQSFSAQEIEGIYAEGDVVAVSRDPDARQDAYTLRAPRVYYDVEHGTAAAVDAVFWTYDQRVNLPLYLRAKTIRQEASNRFSATGARLATTAFFDPAFSIGATSITITRADEPGERSQTIADARNITLRSGPVPFFYWPWFKGDVERIPLRDLRFENLTGSGGAIKSTWSAFALLGLDPPRGFDADLLLDGYFERGFAGGASLGWGSDASRGGLFTYGLPNDTGKDVLSSGAEVRRDGEFRGLVLGEHHWTADEHWDVYLEAAYVSDENFVDAFFDDFAYSRREFTNAAYARRVEDTTAFTALLKGSLNDFTPNEYLLQSRGYNTDKLPELGYFRLADDLFRQDAPGFLTYSSEYRLSAMRLNFTERTARELGFDSAARARAAFGFDDPDLSPGDALRDAGLTESDRYRFDTRQELALTSDWGPLKLNPFLVGRFTGYDDDFSEFSEEADEAYRLWGAASTRVSTSLQRVNNSIDSRFFDLHRVRHIVEPSITAWAAGTNLEQSDLPVYDEQVESIAEGAAIRAGVAQTWQTQRGGHGRWRSVDVLKLRTDFVFSTDDTDRETPVGRFFDYRPEYSTFGDYGVLDVAWQATDSIGLTFQTTYDLELNQPARTILGGVVQHTPQFSTSGELRYINALDITLIGAGADYQLTRKYTLSTEAIYDTDQGEFQSISASLRRRFPSVTLGVSVSHDEIADSTSFGFILQPNALPDRSVSLDRIRNSNP